MRRLSGARRLLDEQILELLRAPGPLTGGQVADALGMQVFGANLALELRTQGVARRLDQLPAVVP